MPAGWLRPVVTPAAMRLRLVLSAAALILAATAALAVGVLAILI
jgi:hypothetical protein